MVEKVRKAARRSGKALELDEALTASRRSLTASSSTTRLPAPMSSTTSRFSLWISGAVGCLVMPTPYGIRTSPPRAVRQGDPGTQILRFARSVHADVIVMGAAGAERPTRPIGSVTATVVARSDCPVLIVPSGRPIDRSNPGVFKRILCAVDLAPASVSVIDKHCRSLARLMGTSRACA